MRAVTEFHSACLGACLPVVLYHGHGDGACCSAHVLWVILQNIRLEVCACGGSVGACACVPTCVHACVRVAGGACVGAAVPMAACV